MKIAEDSAPVLTAVEFLAVITLRSGLGLPLAGDGQLP